MYSLREPQEDFARAVFSDDPSPSGFLARCAGPGAEAGLAAYRRSVRGNLAEAVRTTYPVIERIVGAAFLRATIRRYVLERPSRSGDLNAYGHDFGDFLAAFEPAAGLPYLPDVARLEWCVQQVTGMADTPPQDMSLLARTDSARWGELRFSLDPGHAILASAWPLGRIWAVNQPAYQGDFTVDFAEAQTVLAHRRPSGTVVEVLTPGEAAFLAGLAQGAPFEIAVCQAAEAPGFDLTAALPRFVGDGLLRQALLS